MFVPFVSYLRKRLFGSIFHQETKEQCKNSLQVNWRASSVQRCCGRPATILASCSQYQLPSARHIPVSVLIMLSAHGYVESLASWWREKQALSSYLARKKEKNNCIPQFASPFFIDAKDFMLPWAPNLINMLKAHHTRLHIFWRGAVEVSIRLLRELYSSAGKTG